MEMVVRFLSKTMVHLFRFVNFVGTVIIYFLFPAIVQFAVSESNGACSACTKKPLTSKYIEKDVESNSMDILG